MRFQHGWLTEEIALEVGIAEVTGFGEFLFGFHLLGEQGDSRISIFVHDASALVSVEQLEIYLEIFGAFDEGSEFGVVDEIVERQGVARVSEFAADFDNFVGRSDGFENFDDDTIGREEAWCIEAESEFVDIDERKSIACESVEVEKRDGIGDDTGGGIFGGFDEVVLRAATEEELVGEDSEAFIEDWLAGDEFFGHTQYLRSRVQIDTRVRCGKGKGAFRG